MPVKFLRPQRSAWWCRACHRKSDRHLLKAVGSSLQQICHTLPQQGTALRVKLKHHCAHLKPKRKTKLTNGIKPLLCGSDLGRADDGSLAHWVWLHHIAKLAAGAVRLPRPAVEAWAAGQRQADGERNQSHACNDAQLRHGTSRQSLRRDLASDHHAACEQPHACTAEPRRTSTDTGTRRLQLQQYFRRGTLSLL